MEVSGEMQVLQVSETAIICWASSQKRFDVKVLQFPFFIDAKGDRLIQCRDGAVVDFLRDFAEPFEISAIVNLRCVRYRTCRRSRTYQLDNLGRQFIQHLCRIRSRPSSIHRPRSRASLQAGSSLSFGLPSCGVSCLEWSQEVYQCDTRCGRLRTRGERLWPTVSQEYRLA